MKDTSSLHLKVQELCDCFATTDPLKEMSTVHNDADSDEAALKWIALAVLHGLNSNAREIAISSAKDGSVDVSAEYKTSSLPSPGSAIGQKVVQTVRDITHLGEISDEIPLAMGFRNNSFELKIVSSHSDDQDKISIVFP